MAKHVSLTSLTLLLLTAIASAQFDFGRGEPDGGRYIGGPRLGDSITQIWRAGIIIEAGVALENVQIGVPVPMNWREQRIVSVNEQRMDAQLASRIQYFTHPEGAREMRVHLPRVRTTQPLEIIVEFEVQNFALLPPDNPGQYAIPRQNQLPPDIRQYLQPSPYIESDNRIFARMFADITRDRNTDWDKVEAIYSFVRNNVRYNDAGWAQPVKGALSLVRQPEGEWTADCKDMTCLFVALCRAGGIPARVVRVPRHCYAEFYLQIRPDALPRDFPRGQTPPGFWFPVQVAGDYAFGGIPEQRVILQKGDNFPDPESPNFRGRTIWLREHFMGNVVPGSPRPRDQWVNEVVER